MDAERTKELFARWATDYAADPIVRNPRVDSAILEAAAPKSGESAVDLATGTGFFALEIARLVAPGQVIGTDISPEMLEVARRIAEDAGIANVRFQETPSGSIPTSLGTIDLITCCYALHHLADPPQLLTRSVESLRPGGRIVVADICGNDDPLRNRAMIKLIQARFDPTHRWTYSREEIRTLLRRVGFHDIKIGWLPKLSYIGIHLADVLQTAKADPGNLEVRMESSFLEVEKEELRRWAATETRFEPESIMGVFIATARKGNK